MKPTSRHLKLLFSTSVVAMALGTGTAFAGMDEAKKWIDAEFQPSTLSKDEQMKEMEWFVNAAKPFAGMEINVVSETITTHEYEAKTLAKAFTEITGIKLTHDLIQEGDVVEKIQTQMQSGRNIYDAWVNNSDLIGTHFRYKQAIALDDWMSGEGKDVTSPTLDVADFIGRSFTTAPDGKMYQLPDQQFANLYWFRYDWFQRPDIKEKFKAKYGYELGVPVNWSAYEDIAEFFTNDIKEIDGVKVYGHMDYGKKDPSLGWRFTDAWLSMAGSGDKGIPNGKPVDEWGVRMEGCRPVGSSVDRGGDTNGPAAVYSITKYIDWLKKYAPPQANGMNFSESGTGSGAGQHRPADVLVHGVHRRHGEARPAGDEHRRQTEMAHGSVAARLLLERGHEARLPGCGLVDAAEIDPASIGARRPGSMPSSSRRRAVSLKKSHVGLTFIRESDIWDKSFTERAPQLGGLVEFYRSPARVQWTPTGNNIPDYPKMAQLWWQNIGDASSGAKTPQAAMDALAAGQDEVLGRLERANVQGECGPKLNPKTSAEDWYKKAEADPATSRPSANWQTRSRKVRRSTTTR